MQSRIMICCMLVLTMCSCDSDQVFDKYESVEKRWHQDSLKVFQFDAPDTIHAYNLFVNIRNTNDYAYNNLYLIVEMQYPNGKVTNDTLQYKMAAPDGTLLGKGFSGIKENKLWYKGHEQPFKFTEEGNYKVSVQQAMRKNGNVNGEQLLEGITDVGFRIEKTTE